MFRLSLLAGLMMLFVMACNQGTTEENKAAVAEVSKPDAKVTVYYFHGKQRCTSCLNIQEVSAKTYHDYYGENENVRFMEVDFSEKENFELAEKYEVAFSSLIIAEDDQFVDITKQAFSYVKSDPSELTKLIVKETETLLKL